jgi:hypothetical protein
MILYNLQDSNGNIFELNGEAVSVIERKTLGFDGESFKIENVTNENSFLPGKIKIGKSRLQSRELNFYFETVKTNDNDFNSFINNVIYKLRDVDYLIDVTNDKRIKVTLSYVNVPNDPGVEKRLSTVEFTLECLNPYWEDNTIQSINGNLTAIIQNEINFTNSGFMNVFPIIKITCAASCPSVEVSLPLQYIKIENSLFGTTNYEEMQINNEDGFVALGLTDITKYITDGLGFLFVAPGSTIFEIIIPVTGSYIIEWRRRYYI